MFTGIVSCTAPVHTALQREGILRLELTSPEGFTEGLTAGASVAVNGVCLTVVAWTGTSMSFDVIDESLQRTNLGSLKTGDLVNLERAARFGDEIGGHPLSGHIHTTATLAEKRVEGDNVAMRLEIASQWHPYVISKGYIAINGCSLTIGDVDEQGFWLHLIPETLRITNLSSLDTSAELNVEIDHQTQVIVETVKKVLANNPELSGG